VVARPDLSASDDELTDVLKAARQATIPPTIAQVVSRSPSALTASHSARSKSSGC